MIVKGSLMRAPFFFGLLVDGWWLLECGIRY